MATESPFVRIFEQVAQESLGDSAIVKRSANLYYELSLNRDLKLTQSDTRTPKRGSSAFQTDICIFELKNGIEFPRVVIEFKERITTHDILTYSSKAAKHKQVYPWLRYGILSSELKSIPKRFFTHNEHLDFFIAAHAYKKKKDILRLSKDLINKELSVSNTLEEIYFENKKVDYYSKNITFQNFEDF